MADTTTASDFTVTIPNDLEYVLTRTFDAPRELVFDALTKPEHVVHWFGPRSDGQTMPVCEIDLRVGGAYRFVNRAPDGSEYPFRGEYREIDRPARVAYTWIYDVEPWNRHTAVITALLDEREDGRTGLTVITTCESKVVRDDIINSGMEHGARESYDRLAELLHTIG